MQIALPQEREGLGRVEEFPTALAGDPHPQNKTDGRARYTDVALLQTSCALSAASSCQVESILSPQDKMTLAAAWDSKREPQPGLECHGHHLLAGSSNCSWPKVHMPEA